MLTYVYIPVVQKELDVFRLSVWNNHRVRKQINKEFPTGVQEHIYTCPEQNGGGNCGIPVTEQQLQEVPEFSHVLDGNDDFLDADFHQECQRYIPKTEDIEPAQASNVYLYLKDHIWT